MAHLFLNRRSHAAGPRQNPFEHRPLVNAHALDIKLFRIKAAVMRRVRRGGTKKLEQGLCQSASLQKELGFGYVDRQSFQKIRYHTDFSRSYPKIVELRRLLSRNCRHIGCVVNVLCHSVTKLRISYESTNS